MDNKNFAFGKENFILIAISIAIIILGFCLMLGSATAEGSVFNPAIFSHRRIIVAPIITTIGFASVIGAILKKSKDDKKDDKKQTSKK